MLKIYVLLAALPDPGVPGFQFAGSPPRQPATAPRTRADRPDFRDDMDAALF